MGELKTQRSTHLFSFQHILVHLGDITRYKKDMKQAEIFYTHAAQLIPTNGQPFNQLALLDMHRVGHPSLQLKSKVERPSVTEGDFLY